MTTTLPGVKSCQNCPSFLEPKDASKVRLASGSAMCSRFGRVLGRPGLSDDQNEKIQLSIAQDCKGYGEPAGLGVKPGLERTEVMLPNPKIMMNPPSPADPKHKSVTNCQMCIHNVDGDIVKQELGWSTNLCAAKGKLLFPATAKANSVDCEYKMFGIRSRSVEGMNLYPEYEDAFQLASDPIKNFWKKKRDGLVDPQVYPDERGIPLTAEEIKSGIRAFRRIHNPENPKQFVHLPIFDRDQIPVEDQPKIPMIGDPEHPEDYIDHGGLVYTIAALWTELDETPAAWGEPGVGKTELYRHMAWLMGLPFVRISITGSSELDDLAGKSHFEEGRGTYFKMGRVVTGWSKKCVLCIDEPNTGPPDVWQFLRPLTDNSKQLALDMDEGQIIPRHDDCYLGLALNPDWDPRNRGAEPIADADSSRLMHLWVPFPPPELEKEIVRARIRHDGWEIDDARMHTLMNIADELRKLSEQGDISISWGIRPQIQVARAWRFFDIEKAYSLAVADALEPSQQQVVMDIVRSHKK